MYNVAQGLLLEVQSIVASVSNTPVGGALNTHGSSTAKAFSAVLGQAGGTQAGKSVGDVARELTSFLARLPGMSLTSDAIKHAYGVELLRDDVREDPNDTMRLIQLAEALDAVQRVRFLMRIASVTSPVSLLTSLGMKAAAGLGRGDELSTIEKLLRRAHRVIRSRSGSSTAEDLIVLARVYRLAGKPGLAVRFAMKAVYVAKAEQRDLDEKQSVWDGAVEGWNEKGLGGFFGSLLEGGVTALEEAVTRAGAGIDGDFDEVDKHSVAHMRIGTALVAAAWAFRDLGDAENARKAAQAAIILPFSYGYEVLAAMDQPGDWIGARIGQRIDRLDMVGRMDRNFYRGHSLGAGMITVATGMSQWDKLVRLFQ